MRILILAIIACCVCTTVAAATTAQKAAVAALISAERAHGNRDVEQPSCLIVQTYAQCDFSIAQGREDKHAWLHLKNGQWRFLGRSDVGEKGWDLGVMEFGSAASMMEKLYGIPASVAKQFVCGKWSPRCSTCPPGACTSKNSKN